MLYRKVGMSARRRSIKSTALSGSSGSSGSGDATGPLLPPRKVQHPTLLQASLDARREFSTIDATAEDADVELANGAMRIMAQLHGLAECVGGMAATGLLHLDVSATSLCTTTRFDHGAWISQTTVSVLPTPALAEAKLDPAFCNTVMNALVVMSIAAADRDDELPEYREMAAMLADDWPTTIDSQFEGLMRAAWETRSDARSPVREYPAGRLAHATSQRLCAAARAARAPGELEEASDHALAYTQRTLQWIGSGSGS